MMKDYSKIITGMTSTPWMITEPAMRMICEIVAEHIHGNLSQEDIRIRYQDSRQERKERHNNKQVRGVGVLELAGPIFPKANLMTELSGATSIEQFRSDFRTMMADEAVDAILLDLDSPGGSSAQISEMAAEIRAAREVKPIWAIANTSATSAAYYLGCSADKLFASPSSLVANIGTIMVYRDETKQNEMFGITETPIASSKIKAVGHGPLDQESTAYLQSIVDDVNADFVSGVALGRRVSEETVKEKYGDGAIMTANQGLEAGVVDGVATFDEVVSEMLSTGFKGGSIDRVAATTVIVNNPVTASSGTTSIRQDDGLDAAHGEPGPAGEPIPRDPPEKDDLAIKGGWRRDTPPAEVPEESTNVPTVEGGKNRMDHEQLIALANALGIDVGEDDDDGAIYDRVLETANDVQPLMVATAETRDFAKDYPEQALRMRALETADRENKANQFASQFEKVTKNDKTYGYSALMISKIEESHTKLSSRSFTEDDLKSLLETAFDSVVDMDEEGSSRAPAERAVIDPNTTRQEVRKQFADLVNEIKNEDGFDRKTAIAEAARREPELAAAYATR